jgi:DNA-binding NarL/FixJ family response regulator
LILEGVCGPEKAFPRITAIAFSMTKKMRILVADDQEIVREGLRAIIEREPGWKVCGEAENGKELIKLAKQLKPDAIILDLKMPEIDGLAAVKQIRRAVPETEILVLGTHESEDLIEQVFESGAKSYVRKAEAGRLLVPALKSLQNHKIFLTDEVSAMLFSRFLGSGGRKRKDSRASEKLTARQREIVRLLAAGKGNKEVALALGISTRTCEAHRAAMMRKLRLHSLAAIVLYAIRSGIVDA